MNMILLHDLKGEGTYFNPGHIVSVNKNPDEEKGGSVVLVAYACKYDLFEASEAMTTIATLFKDCTDNRW